MTPGDTPSPREFGELSSDVKAIREQLGNLQRTNGEEHRANAQRMERLSRDIREGLESKADRDDLDKHTKDIEGLKSDRDKASGRDRVIMGALGSAITFLAILLSGAHL